VAPFSLSRRIRIFLVASACIWAKSSTVLYTPWLPTCIYGLGDKMTERQVRRFQAFLLDSPYGCSGRGLLTGVLVSFCGDDAVPSQQFS
jgi:hypothetical protein